MPRQSGRVVLFAISFASRASSQKDAATITHAKQLRNENYELRTENYKKSEKSEES